MGFARRDACAQERRSLIRDDDPANVVPRVISRLDGVMRGHEGASYHLEFTRKRGHTAGRAPTQDNLLVFYIPDSEQ